MTSSRHPHLILVRAIFAFATSAMVVACGTAAPVSSPTPTAAASVAIPPASPSPQTPSAAPTAPAPTAASPSLAGPTSFTSQVYGYSVMLPAGWTALKPATEKWTGTGAPGHDSAVTDLFQSASGTVTWVYAAPVTKSLAAFTAQQTAADAAEHPCPATPEIDQATEIRGEAARLTVKHCPPAGGILVAMAAVIHNGVGYVLYFQHPPAALPDPNDVAVFQTLLGGVRLP